MALYSLHLCCCSSLAERPHSQSKEIFHHETTRRGLFLASLFDSPHCQTHHCWPSERYLYFFLLQFLCFTKPLSPLEIESCQWNKLIAVCLETQLSSLPSNARNTCPFQLHSRSYKPQWTPAQNHGNYLVPFWCIIPRQQFFICKYQICTGDTERQMGRHQYGECHTLPTKK